MATTDPRKTGITAVPYIGRGTFAQMKAITGMSGGDMYFCTSYPENKGSVWVYNSTAADWFPVAPCKVYEQSATLSGVAQTGVQTLLTFPVAAGLLTNKVFRMLVTVAKSGGTDTVTPVIRLGPNASSADTLIISPGTLSGASRSYGAEPWSRMASATSVERLGGGTAAPWNGANSANVVNNATAVTTVANATNITITCTMSGTSDTPQLGYVALEIQP